MTEHPEAAEKLRALREKTAASSNAGTVSAIATTGHVVSGGLLAAGAVSAANAGMAALKCFGSRVAAPLAGAMAGAWVAEKVHADEAAFRVAQQFGAKRLAGPGKNAAHLKHQIAHSNVFAGILAGLAVGAAIAVGAALIIGTAGMASPLVGAAVGFGAGFMGAAIAGAGAKTATMEGPITSGSPNVLFEGQPAARVTDTATCSKHSGPPSQIIEGSQTILINGLPMARIGHKLSCDAVVQEGCATVLGDDTTGSYGTPDADLSIAEQLVLSVAEVAGTYSSVREGGLLDGLLRKLFGEPVDIVTGDYADSRVDFTHPGLLPLTLERTYPGRMRVDGALGPRWICNWSQRLLLDEPGATALLEDAGGQRLRFALGDALQIDARHLKAPYYHLTGTRDRLRLYDSRSRQCLVFAPLSDQAVLELAAIEDRSGNRITFHRDPRGHLREIRHPDGTLFQIETTPQGWLRTLRMAGEAEPLVRYAYDAAGHLLEVQGTFTGEFHYRYTPEGWLNAWRDSGPTSVEIAYDSAGRVIATQGPEGLFNDRFHYFPEQRRSRYVDATGAAREFRYDANNLVVEEIDPLGARWISAWDSLEKLQRRIDPAGRETRYAHDRDGRCIMQTDWAGRRTSWTYDRWGALTRIEDGEGATAFTHDACGRLIRWQAPDGRSGTATYDARGALLSAQTSGEGATLWENDAAGRPLARHDPGERITRYQWDRMGRMIALTDPAGRVSRWDYRRSPENPRGNLALARTPDGGENRFAYDSEGLLAARIRSDGQTVRFTHGAFDTLRAVTDPLGPTTRFAYDGAGRLAAITDAAGQHWQFRYDPAGRLAAQSDWAGRETLYRRDPLGRVLAKRLPDGRDQQFEWDERDRITRVVAGEDAISYRYDERDRLIGASTWQLVQGAPQCLADVTLHYDDKGRLLREEQNGIAITYRYDAAGRCIGRASPSGETSLAFDDAGLLTRYESNGHALRFSHDVSGLETLRELTALGSATAFQLRQRYDPAGRIAEQRAGPVPVFASQREAPDAVARRYEWDAVGRLAATSEAGAETRYRYDPRDQAVSVERPEARETYRYDALMNLAEGLAGEHRYWRDCVVEAGPNRFRYDACGRMVERVLVEDGFRPRRWRYRWDGFDRLVGLETPDGARWRYTYDAFGRRVGKARLGEAARQVAYLWQGQTLAEAWHREDAAESLRIERWHFEPDGLRPLAKELVQADAAGDPMLAEADWHPIVADQLGAPHALFDADGTCRWRAAAQLWGRTRTARALLRERLGDEEPSPCALRFPGQWEDEESGLHYNLNRYYDPETGQYLSPDPIGVSGGVRTHAYVHDPLHWMDPLGLAECKWGDWYAAKTGTKAPKGMPRPHAHHIIFKGEFADLPEMQAALGRSRTVAAKYGIDPVNDPDALMWAPNRGHSIDNAETVASRLEAADARISAQNLPKAQATATMKTELQTIGNDVFGWP